MAELMRAATPRDKGPETRPRAFCRLPAKVRRSIFKEAMLAPRFYYFTYWYHPLVAAEGP
jgi:hypothetical protein